MAKDTAAIATGCPDVGSKAGKGDASASIGDHEASKGVAVPGFSAAAGVSDNAGSRLLSSTRFCVVSGELEASESPVFATAEAFPFKLLAEALPVSDTRGVDLRREF